MASACLRVEQEIHFAVGCLQEIILNVLYAALPQYTQAGTGCQHFELLRVVGNVLEILQMPALLISLLAVAAQKKCAATRKRNLS